MTPQQSRVERRKQATRERLIQAIYTLTAQQGVEAIKIQDIAEAADIATGSFYNYFKTKEELLTEAIREKLFENAEMIDGVIAAIENPIEKITTAILLFDRVMQSDRMLGWFVINLQDNRPEVASTFKGRVARDIQLGVDQGYFEVPHLEMVLDLYGASLFTFYKDRMERKVSDGDVIHFLYYMFRLLGAVPVEVQSAIDHTDLIES